jgi:hypothetical protein
MNKMLLVVVFAVAALTASAQTEKGTIMLGGSLSYSTSKSEAAGAKASTNFTIMPKAGYFLANNIAAGLGLGYSVDEDGGGKTQSFSIAPFGRDYISLSDQFRFFAELSVPFQSGKTEDAAGNDAGEVTSIGANLSPGFVFFPTKKFGIELSFSGISYQNTKTEDAAGNKVNGASGNSFSIGANSFAPSLGLQFHF